MPLLHSYLVLLARPILASCVSLEEHVWEKVAWVTMVCIYIFLIHLFFCNKFYLVIPKVYGNTDLHSSSEATVGIIPGCQERNLFLSGKKRKQTKRNRFETHYKEFLVIFFFNQRQLFEASGCSF